MTPTCSANQKTVGDIVTIIASPMGIGPFSVIFHKNGIQMGDPYIVSKGTTSTFNYMIVAEDADLQQPVIFSVTAKDIGYLKASPCTESCYITIVNYTASLATRY